jgi:hypothetical protein
VTTYTLHGNCTRCEACALRREALGNVFIDVGDVPCNACQSTGLIPLSDEEIVRQMVEEALRTYWPAFNARLQAAGIFPTVRQKPERPIPDAPAQVQLLLFADLADVTLQP